LFNSNIDKQRFFKKINAIPYFNNLVVIFLFFYELTLSIKLLNMSKTYYDPADLKKFGNISDWNKELGTKFFDYYEKVFEEGALTAREKSLIALAVAHTEQCPYCIDAYTKDGLERGITKEEMMEALHVGAAIKSGASLVHGVQMMNKVNKLEM